MVPALGLSGRQDKRIPSWAWSLLVGREIPCCTKVGLFKEHTRDKVRRHFTLLVTARVGGTKEQATTGSGYGDGPGYCRCTRLAQIRATITVVPTEKNKMLNGSGG